MTNYLPNTRANEVGNILFSPASEAMATTSTRAQKGLSSVDTVQTALEVGIKKGVPTTGRPILPPVKTTLPQDEWTIIATAFCEAYTAMRNSIKTETENYAGLQELDQTQVQVVLATTSAAIENLKIAEQKSAELQAYQEKLANFEGIFGKSMFWIGVFMLAVTIGSALCSGGISLFAVPEEAGMFELAELGGEVGADVGADLAEEAVDVAASTLDAAADTGAAAAETTSFNWGSFFMRMGVAGAFSSPMLVSGISNAILNPKLEDLAAAQKLVGESLSVETSNNMYLQFLQQLIKREGDVVTEGAKAASGVIDTYAGLINAIRGISYGLANSV